ncbi:uncharacterized protein LOC6536922 [Drosophila yakuba]|uniref:Uncharacterized protein n=1 Tax=Drosophila yakuba TaxID=7245 RepID=B4PPX6_DROYA|nr:uncharacterized protein LOC6536922 [Drosophila yakuba]XP_039491941.1 uncharacterized protein LOC120451980 isoform X1 [Drosophila santomea]EDW97203.1 uncharacterized protein Dyak_GE26251 [Drosophila yakuba]
MFLSRKEIVSLLLFLTAIISVLNASVFGNVLPLHVSYEQLAQQVVCVGTAYICLIYALSTWLYHSNYSRTRLHMRLVLLAMLLIMILFNCCSTYYFLKGVSFSKLGDSMELVFLFSSFAVASKSVSLSMSAICVALLIVIMVILIVTIIQTQRRHRRDRERNLESQK